MRLSRAEHPRRGGFSGAFAPLTRLLIDSFALGVSLGISLGIVFGTVIDRPPEPPGGP